MKQIQSDHISKIYSLLADDISKEIFENRLMHSLTGDVRFIRNVVCTFDIGKMIYEKIKATKQPIGIFGAGSLGRRLFRVYDDIPNFKCFIDNKLTGKVYGGLPVVSLDKFKQMYPDGVVLIATNLYHKEIMEQMLMSGIDKRDIINLGLEYERLNHKQYFDLPELEKNRKQKEVFVDGGAYNGNTSVDFKRWCSGRECFVYAWEPDQENMAKCEKTLNDCDLQYELINKGLWKEYGLLRFQMEGTSSSISEEGAITIETDSIDHVCRQPVTFIKMDVEGSEYMALLGAKNTIKKYKPNLAICIYHKSEDIWELPWLIHEIDPEYKFYLRHYSFADTETVLYALH